MDRINWSLLWTGSTGAIRADAGAAGGTGRLAAG